MENKGKISIIGSGLIGRSWTLLFIGAGYKVCLYDIVEEKTNEAISDIRSQLENLSKKGLLRGKLSVDQQFSLVCGTSSLNECLKDCIYCQECVFEDLQLKRQLFRQIDGIVNEKAILASSTSCFLPSLFSDSLKNCAQVIVAHPVNPPYFVPLVEVVPAPWTKEEVVSKAKQILLDIGQKPVILKKEIAGFIVNRIQYSILNECYRLIRDDVISVQDIDAVMSEGLGMRYAFIGPWETAHLNAQGMKQYFEKYANGIYNVSLTFGDVPIMEGPTAEKIITEMTKQIPIESLDERRRWRDERLIALSQIKKPNN